MRIFVSHSRSDASVAKPLVDLLRNALNIPAESIRCTSLDGYRLPGGVPVAETLRQEVHQAEIVLALITPVSVRSPWVLFELGARWGSGKRLLPILASGADPGELTGPLHDLSPLDCTQRAQVHQIVEDVGSFLSLKTATASSYEDKIDELLRHATPTIASGGLSDDARSILRTFQTDALKLLDGLSAVHLQAMTGLSKRRTTIGIEELGAVGLVTSPGATKGYVKTTGAGERYLDTMGRE